MHGWIKALTLAACCVGGTAAAQLPVHEFRKASMCNASAAVPVDERKVMIGDNEKRRIATFDIVSGRMVDDTDLPNGAGADIEGGTILDGRVVWITSHGRNADGQTRPGRRNLFVSHRFTRPGAVEPVPIAPFTGLLRAIRDKAAYDPVFARVYAAIGEIPVNPDLAPKRQGFNIEGLTTTEGLLNAPAPLGLLIGLRNPAAADGRAILFELPNAAALLDRPDASTNIGRTFLLDLGGRRIRDIAWSARARAYLVVGGPVGDAPEKPAAGGPAFAVFKWKGGVDHKPERIDAFGDIDALDDFHAEAIVPLLSRENGVLAPSNRVLLLSDDGKRKINGVVCNDLPDGQKFFRGVIATVE